MSLVEREKGVLKEENQNLQSEISSLKQELAELKQLVANSLSRNSDTNQTDHTESQTDMPSSTSLTPLFSTGNEGVQTNRQTDALKQNTSRTTEIPEMFDTVNQLKSELKQKFRKLTKQEFKVFSAIYILEEQRDPTKQTKQNSDCGVDYPALAGKLGLSETAIRDYIMKLRRKGIPLVKTKVNNKKVLLSIRQELKLLANLDALIKVREPIFR